MNMFLKEKRKGEKLKDPKKKKSAIANAALSGNKNENGNGNGAAGRLTYKTCGRLYDDVCYTERPDLASD